MNFLVPILLQIVLITLNAIFASAEAAFLSINSARIEKIIEEGNKKTRKKARTLQKLTRDSSKFLSSFISNPSFRKSTLLPKILIKKAYSAF